MTVTVKLDPRLEELLRRRALSSGRSTSEVVRAALQSYLATEESTPARSAYALGQELFGRYAATPELAERRKQAVLEAWDAKHRGGR